MGRVAWKGKNCCVENESTPPSFDVDVLRKVFAARLAVCMLTVFARTGSRVPVVVAHTTQMRHLFACWNPLFVFEIFWNVLFTQKRLEKRFCLPGSQPVHIASPENTNISPPQACLFLSSCPVNPIHTTYHAARVFVRYPRRLRTFS